MAMKPCPYCAELIQEAAIKCRFCQSVLTSSPSAQAVVFAQPIATPGAPAPVEPRPAPAPVEWRGDAPPTAPPQAAASGTSDERIFDGTPSWKSEFWAHVLSVTLMAGLFLMLASWVLFIVPVAGAAYFGYLYLKRKTTHYVITTDYLELARGILSRETFNIQLWRIQDVHYQQELHERILGVARFRFVTQSKEHPELVLPGLPGDRTIYERLRNSMLIARQARTGVRALVE